VNKVRLLLIELVALLVLLVFAGVILIQRNTRPAAPAVTATAVAHHAENRPTGRPTEAGQGAFTPESPPDGTGGNSNQGSLPGVTVIPPINSTPVSGNQPQPAGTNLPALPTAAQPATTALPPTPLPTVEIVPTPVLPTAVPTVEVAPTAIQPTAIPPTLAPTSEPPAGENPDTPVLTESFLPLVFAAQPTTPPAANPEPDAEEPAPPPANSRPDPEEPRAPDGRSFYVDCENGNDNKNGQSKKAAWKTLARANQAQLQPGDSLLFKRGCSWTGPLKAKWQGTSEEPILIGAYSNGELPRIQDADNSNVKISGKYQVIQDLHATITTLPNPDPTCNNQPRGWKVGFSFDPSSSYNTLQGVKATNLTVGVYFTTGSNHNRLVNSTITDNHVLHLMTANAAQGATGVLLHGNYNEIARNYFANNHSICTYDGIQESISIELYAASNSNIHHNTIYKDRVFIELGSSPAWTSENTVLAYNLHVTDYSHERLGARFVVTRGYGHQFGPVLNTLVLNNIVYLTGKGSTGIACQECDNDILTVRNNILWANDEPFSVDNRFVESNNIFWSNDGDPTLRWPGFTQSSTSLVADPQFTDPQADTFSLKSTSPAINRGTLDVVAPAYKWDLAGKPIPAAGAPDIGAFETQ
jgi:hypothetical protein